MVKQGRPKVFLHENVCNFPVSKMAEILGRGSNDCEGRPQQSVQYLLFLGVCMSAFGRTGVCSGDGGVGPSIFLDFQCGVHVSTQCVS